VTVHQSEQSKSHAGPRIRVERRKRPRRAGRWLGKYVLVRRIGKGGTGCVYDAFDTALERAVAVKVLAGERARQPGVVKEFINEARSFARVNHPNAVTILDVNCRDGVYFLVMERMSDGNLQDALDRGGPLGWVEATRVTADACRALVATHAAGLVHRGVKPSNLMLGPGGLGKLADFGIATDVLAGRAPPVACNTVTGTPQFMSPEQCRGEPVDVRSDVYSLGATYYALLTGRPPYRAKLRAQVMFAHCASPVPDPRDVVPSVAPQCATIVRKAMSREPAGRYQSASDMLGDLERCAASGHELPAARGGEGASASMGDRTSQPRRPEPGASVGQ